MNGQRVPPGQGTGEDTVDAVDVGFHLSWLILNSRYRTSNEKTRHHVLMQAGLRSTPWEGLPEDAVLHA